MVTLNRPASGDTNWFTPVDNNWALLETAVNGVVRVMKTVDESLASSTILQDDDELKFSVGANETWQFEIMGFWTCTSTTPDIKVGLNGPGTLQRAVVQFTNATGWSPADGAVFTSYSDNASVDLSSVPTNSTFSIKGTLVNGATPGTFVLQWAQRVSNATSIFVKAGSYLVAHRI